MIEVPALIYSIFVVLLAGFIRGYSGFGASMVVVIGLSLVMPVTDIVPVILLLEIIASSFLLPKVFNEVDWPSLSNLLMGVIIGTPVGVYILANASDKIMRSAVSILASRECNRRSRVSYGQKRGSLGRSRAGIHGLILSV